MATRTITFYPHRQNRDGSFDSVCLKCFATIANAKEVTELRSYETEHVCIPSMLSNRGQLRKRVLPDSR